ncbi:MAG: LysR substrate-binding domain-containing protein [Beijerinckiaceae bacterium]
MLINLDIDLLRTFVEVADVRSFTRAGERLLRNQSTVSLQIKRLEEAVGHRLLQRSPRLVTLTPHGETLLEFARRIVSINDEAVGQIAEREVKGVVRLGAPEDFATSHLPDALSRFSQAYPAVTLEVTCDLTLNLLDGYREGEFDLVLVKREPSPDRDGVRVWHEPLVWVAGPLEPHILPVIPLVVSPAPCVYRKRAIDSLNEAGRVWRIAYSCTSLAGALAAVKAGLGITVLPRDMVPAGLRMIETSELPELPDTEIALLSRTGLGDPGQRLHEHIVRSLEQGA